MRINESLVAKDCVHIYYIKPSVAFRAPLFTQPSPPMPRRTLDWSPPLFGSTPTAVSAGRHLFGWDHQDRPPGVGVDLVSRPCPRLVNLWKGRERMSFLENQDLGLLVKRTWKETFGFRAPSSSKVPEGSPVKSRLVERRPW